MQELESLDSKGKIELYYADESHVCTDGYVPYGWQFKDEHVYIPSEKATRLNIFGMITRRNQYKIKEMRKIWEDRGLFLFYLPPYSPELNPAETLWCILKGKWIRPADYNTKDSLFYCINKALVSVGTNLFVNYS